MVSFLEFWDDFSLFFEDFFKKTFDITCNEIKRLKILVFWWLSFLKEIIKHLKELKVMTSTKKNGNQLFHAVWGNF